MPGVKRYIRVHTAAALFWGGFGRLQSSEVREPKQTSPRTRRWISGLATMMTEKDRDPLNNAKLFASNRLH